MILRAKNILPVTAPPIEDGAVFIDGNKVRAVLPWKNLRPHTTGKIYDLGEVILLPGLVNAHCHLDYTDMAGELPAPKNFTDWIGAITAHKTGWSYSDYARSWLHGAHQLLKTGTTTVADIEAMPDLLPEVWEATPLRVFSFLEMTGIKSRRQPKEILHEAVEKIDSLRHPRHRTMLSPHAPYSTLPELLRLTAAVARKRNWRVCTHIAESEQEFEMFQNASGGMHRWLARNGRDNSDCGLGSPVAHYARNKLLGANVLAIHVNYLARGDATLLAKTKTNIVHCPRSHDYFKHTKFERERLLNAGVNICLGTDSLATTRKTGKHKPELDMFAEMRLLADRDKAISSEQVVSMATVNGARALGLAGKIGEISKNSFADLIALPAPDKFEDIHEAVLAHTGNVSASMIDGRWAIPPKL
ncbi:MAG: amidohydrolase family protein [Verrucomicrobia bacterium]|nr:amidohydrolase family protein [Verrucomicrobiota bacterium]